MSALRDEVARVRAVAERTGGYAYSYIVHEGWKTEVRVGEDGRATVTVVDDDGAPRGKPRRVRRWS